MRIDHLIVFLLPLFASVSLFAQTEDAKRAIAAHEAGVNHLLEGKARRASKEFRRSVELDTSFMPGWRLLGAAQDMLGNYPEALAAYTHVIERDPFFSRLLFYQTGELLLRTGNGPEALRYFDRFRNLQSEDLAAYGLMGQEEEETEKSILEKELPQKLLSARMLSDSLNYTNASGLYNLGETINSKYNDYFPFFSNDRSQLLYTRQDRAGDEDLMEGNRRRDGMTFKSGRFSQFNTRQPEGMCTLVRDGETIFFTLCHESRDGGGCDLYSGTLIDGKIEKVTPLPNHVISSAWDSQAAISCDGRQLFFASTRPGGLGGSDLYACYRKSDGSWSEPRNLGDGVNTPEDEEAPFLSNDGETLYFSSMGHRGMGDQDIFFSRYDRQRDAWSKAVNLGPPINSANRELGFHLTADGQNGFFASDRPGGFGGLDIYGFVLNDELTGRDVTYVSGYVTDSLTGEPIAGQEVPIGGDLFRTNYAGRFFICAPPDRDLPVRISRASYTDYQRDFAIPSWDNATPYRLDVRLRRPGESTAPAPPPAFEPTAKEETTFRVLFDFERDELSPEQLRLLTQHIEEIDPNRISSVKIVGYTDEVGTDDYNLDLSQRRADSVGEYLGELGVADPTITLEGRGELSGRDNRDGNRRVEITIRLKN